LDGGAGRVLGDDRQRVLEAITRQRGEAGAGGHDGKAGIDITGLSQQERADI
jgi:hypothetical protein